MSSITVSERYELIRQMGQGGMGQIWEAYDNSLRRPVAIKLMVSKHLGSRIARARFSREAMAIAAIQSPHVVQIFDAGVHGDSPYLVMERLTGEDLHARLARVERLSLSALAPIIVQIAKALEVANARNIVHRDLKPANIFLARTETGEEVVKLLDFGVAAVLAATEFDDENSLDIALNSDLVGTPHYMSPEQVRAGMVDHRSDLWSLAILAYRALAGAPPFHSEHLGRLLVSICADRFVPLSTRVPDLSEAVDSFFSKALAKDPAKRFPTATEFAAAFASLVNSVSGSAKILVTDDEPDVSTIVQKKFRKQIQEKKYQFVFASDGEDALRMLREHPDIEMVLTDINMPRMDGLTFLSRMNEVNPLARAVVVSAYSDLSNIRTAMNRGAFDFLVKPIDFKDLATTIDKTLKHVAEVRKGVLSNEQNAFLRMSVTPRLFELPHVATAPPTPETWSCTVAVIGIGSEAEEGAVTDPRHYVRVLNSNLEVIIPAILRHRGVIDRFVGRSIIAIFRGEDHLHQALDACCRIRTQLSRLARRTGDDSPFAVGIHIGVTMGQIVAAEIGSRAFERVENTLFGEILKSANLLHRIAGKNQVLVDGAIANASRDAFDYEVAVPSDAAVSGQLYELLGRTGARAASEASSGDSETIVDPSGIRFVGNEPSTRASQST